MNTDGKSFHASRHHRSGMPVRRALVRGTLYGVTALLATAGAAGAATPPVSEPVGGYPDGRKAELVSTADTNGAPVAVAAPAADDGSTVAFEMPGASDDALASPQTTATVARRTGSGWALKPANPQVDNTFGGSDFFPVAFSPAFDRLLVRSTAIMAPDDRNVEPDAYSVDLEGPTPTATRISKNPLDPTTTGGDFTVNVIGASADRRTVIFSMGQDNPLADGAAPSTATIYRWRDGELEIASRLPDGSTTQSPFAQTVALSAADYGTQTSFTPRFVAHGGTHATSEDGSRVYFANSDLDFNLGQFTQTLYVRDGDRTLPVSGSRRPGDDPVSLDAQFIGASRDGGTAYFHSNQALTTAANTGGLYRYTVDGDELELLTPATTSGQSGITGAILSDDSSTLYFVSTEKMTADAIDGQQNAYRWTADGLDLVSTWSGAGATVDRVTRDGRYVVFRSYASIGGAQNADFQALYRYDAEADELDCVSCRPDGAPSTADAALDVPYPSPAVRPGGLRNIADDGTVFFLSRDRIVAGDTNDVHDVYRYGADGPRLLTPGTGDEDSFLGDNSDDGKTVFVLTASRLVAADRDAGVPDAYALRVGGGFADPPPAPADCDGETCRPPESGRPPAPLPRSSVPGAGNVDPPKLPERKPGGISTLKAPSRSALRTLAKQGKVKVRVAIRGGGRITLKATASVDGRNRTVGSGSRTIRSTRFKTVSVRLRLSPAARRELRRSGRLRMRLAAEVTGSNATLVRRFTVRSGR